MKNKLRIVSLLYIWIVSHYAAKGVIPFEINAVANLVVFTFVFLTLTNARRMILDHFENEK